MILKFKSTFKIKNGQFVVFQKLSVKIQENIKSLKIQHT